jgi:integrase/recombinase XerD
MKQARTLTDKQLKAVLAYCSTRRHAARDRAIIATSFYAGLRAKEIAALKRTDVLNADNTIRNEFVLAPAQTKGGKTRRVFVSSKLKRELDAYLKELKASPRCEALFQSQKDRAFSANTMCQLFLNIYKACGIDGASSHSGRRSLLTNLAARGVGVRVLAEIAGHSSISVTQRYLDVNDEQMRAAVELA